MRVILPEGIRTGQDILLARAALPGATNLVLEAPWPCPLRAGQYLDASSGPAFQVMAVHIWNADGRARRVYQLCAQADLPAGNTELTPRPHDTKSLSLAWITLSDSGAAGLRDDASGPLIAVLAADHYELSLVRGQVLPDDVGLLKAALVDLAITQGFDLILTTGGTGLTPRDVTPEATAAVIERRLEGLERAMTVTGLAKTPTAALSRAVAGTLGQSIIVNLPGSPKAVAENLAAILPALGHASEKLKGDPTPCGG